jgi:hypothetical protein
MNWEALYKIMYDGTYPQCCAYGLTEAKTRKKLQELREKDKDNANAIWYRVFTVDGDSRYW